MPLSLTDRVKVEKSPVFAFQMCTNFLRQTCQAHLGTVNLDHTKQHYVTHREINPTGIVPLSAPRDFSWANGLERL